MKRYISLLLCLVMVLPLIACSEEKVKLEKPVHFYYRRAEINYEQDSGVITAEDRESAGHEEDIRYLLTDYLSGPVSSELDRTFPEDIFIVSLHLADNTAKITFSHHLSMLNGIDLTVACACITLTVIELTGVETVQLSAAGTLLGDYQFITMDKDCLLLLDNGAKSK